MTQLTCNECQNQYSPTRGGHCTQCHESFGSDRAFDRHRTGTYEPDERRCFTPDEMIAKGIVPNERGYWIKADVERARPEHWTSSTR